ncbi:hypothetical protein PVAP13_9KG062457 [Panicum virgatum]|uniref:Uncharacterized protein n=1 Tax=Panicum virgatum TaxID=38727 RepID=A0A8T0NCZ2_PANVG|nr:hypothetical protein PVAP13_9KG062457 [Panicum virgatum]
MHGQLRRHKLLFLAAAEGRVGRRRRLEPNPSNRPPRESLLDPSFLDRADVEIILAAAACGGVVPATAVGAYSCLLARSPFFRHHISARPAGEKLRFELAELVPGGHRIGREALVSVLGSLYTARPPKVPPRECVDHKCTHQACRPAIDFVVEATYAASGFQIHELIRLFQRRLYEIVNIAFDEDILPIIIVAYECKLLDLLSHCIQNVAISNLDSTYLEKKLPDDIYRYIKEFCRQSSLLTESHTFFMDPDHESTKIHKALDSGNVDLVGMLLKQSTVTLDDAFAIHYAAAHCKPEVLKELLKLDSANVNMRNHGGYTPLHMACMRLEPDIIVSLLRKGASVPIQTRRT